MTKRKVTVKIDGSKDAHVTAAGRTISEGATSGTSPSGEGADVELDLKNRSCLVSCKREQSDSS